ncbi:Phosphorus acquisition-controlling [Hyphodiscus hymeniophilus]|uniref:Phosphorus acquisition-controlling n=1 Tax=Hyphodiscus hymeniophilus TaxID=353542 RepID=A0A9P6VNZ4_9HELO|nr:Phosphorus acquisition-controlling [Hyphodiscus hymeniophilus]
MDSSGGWNGHDASDFGGFLDLEINNLGFDFQDFNSQQNQAGQMMHQSEGDSMDTTMQEHMPSMTSSTSHPTIAAAPIAHTHHSSDSLVELDAQIQALQYQRQQQHARQMQELQRSFYAQSRMIPPTPNSVEMHGGSAQFYPQSDPQQQAMYERFRMQVKEQEMAFTPLVSPAVTPLEPHFNIPEYTVPGAYFSPLSSPALHAQNEQISVYDRPHSGTTNSPIDLNTESHSAPNSSALLSRKSSRKPPQKQRSTRSVKQSPIVKPRKAKKGSITSLPAQALSGVLEPSNTGSTNSKTTSSSHSAISTEESENDSISPEHLSDMAPPPLPLPGSAGRSPYVQAQKNGRNGVLPLGSPATPASLMRLPASPATEQHSANQDIDMDEFCLPEAATVVPKPSLSRIETQSDGQTTPTLSSTSARTPGFQPLPSPAFARPRLSTSASQSPQIDAMNGTNGNRKTPQLAARGTKKRTSSSVLASPALLPRISPSIKPLLPGGGSVSEDTASLLLASKSNYQNILEGTHLPGVSYPMELSTNLTSKRTSHKIAEQGRRNRINSALQEIATLLPRNPGKDSSGEKSGSGDGGETGKGAAAQSANSKASTVELAIEYIKQLKSDLEEATKRAEEAERRLGVT